VVQVPVEHGRFRGGSSGVMACLHSAIVAAIGRETDRRDRLHVCLHDAIVAAIGRATDRAIGRATDRRDDRTV